MNNFIEKLKEKVNPELLGILELAIAGETPENDLTIMLDDISDESSNISTFTLSSGDIIYLKHIHRANFKVMVDKKSQDYVGAIQFNLGCVEKENFSGEIIKLVGDLEEAEEEFDQFVAQLKKYKR